MTILSLLLAFTFANQGDLHWMKINTSSKYERSAVANTGAVIEVVKDDYVIAIGSKEEKEAVEKLGLLDTTFILDQKLAFPPKDERFHTYKEVVASLEKMAQEYPQLVDLEIIGQSFEGRNLYNLRISSELEDSHNKPGIAFMGTHHAREHLSTEIPLRFAQHLLSNYATNERIRRLIDSREIHIIPMVNPDGVEYDIKGGRYKSWRKNRRENNDGTMGVDLNRNYGYKWGTGGSSKSPRSDVFMGPKPFSEPESHSIKTFVESKENINILISFHTFSELILYPWGHSYDSIQDSRSFKVHKTMAERMAKWNGYKPQQSSDLYIASGDTTDWSFGAHGIISFTFELDPASIWEGGFYPGQDFIDPTLKKNLEPCLYLIDLADNPYRVLDRKSKRYGLNYLMD